jgi:hypothetical protein
MYTPGVFENVSKPEREVLPVALLSLQNSLRTRRVRNLQGLLLGR